MQWLAYLLGMAHVVFGATKLAGLPLMAEQFRAWELPHWMMIFVGISQLLGGALLFTRRLRLPAAFAMGLIMIGAIVTVVSTGHELFNAPLCLVIGGLCFWTAFYRLNRLFDERIAMAQAKSGKPS